ncbi:hypothetical protein SNE40_014118 [Patella caerulea]|uniref:DUF7869 domain-containing protein n=1 Tax=Patella caerulea TaxID=87958 RepID=A0AAN8PS59_PATCE
MDTLVKWQDGSENIVARKELRVIGGGRIAEGRRVMMWWGPDARWWKGTAIKILTGKATTSFSSSESDDDIPLILLKENINQSINADDISLIDDVTDTSMLAEAVDVLNSSLLDKIEAQDNPEQVLTGALTKDEQLKLTQAIVNPTSESGTSSEQESEQDFLDPDYELSSDSAPEPENFVVEGETRQPLREMQVQGTGSTNKKKHASEVKKARLNGESFVSPNSGRHVDARNMLKPRCTSRLCGSRGFACELISDERRVEINKAYYSLGHLKDQRHWISRHVNSKEIRMKLESGRKSKKNDYYLPFDDNNDRVRVCRITFLNTVNVAERQVRTVLSKTDSNGVMEPERRGGRPAKSKDLDMQKQNLVITHINRFPKMESHYCRSNTNFQYLSSELGASKMYEMYSKEHPSIPVSFRYYWACLQKLKLKFSSPKKDLCGICEGYRQGTDQDKDNLLSEYENHIKEKTTVRVIKDQLKKEDNNRRLVASFDLQQVIYLPRSNRCEIFYKRRLSCYNFSVCDIKSMDANCYVWNETIAGRGSNEISSFLAAYLNSADKMGYEKASLFCDGCGGQNKNSIVGGMLLNLMQSTKCLQEVTIHYFETNHRQSEGDAVHSVIERAMRKVNEIFIPTELSLLIKMASSKPYTVIDASSKDIFDYKKYSQDIGMLRPRISLEGNAICWPNFTD